MMAGNAAWDDRLAQMDATRGRRSASAPAGKGKPPARECPPDFDVIFVEIGRLACETWFRASRTTINRWLKERGMKRLVKQRAAFVAHERANGQWMTRQTRMVESRSPARHPRIIVVKDRRRVPQRLAQMAADHLRIVRNGGWVIVNSGPGVWIVGTCRKSSAELVEMAERRGFDRKAANLQIEAENSVRG